MGDNDAVDATVINWQSRSAGDAVAGGDRRSRSEARVGDAAVYLAVPPCLSVGVRGRVWSRGHTAATLHRRRSAAFPEGWRAIVARVERANWGGRILSPESRVCELSLVHAGAYDGDGCRIIIIIVPAKTIGKGAHTRGSVTDGQDVELPMSFEVRAGDERQCRGDGVESFTGSTWGMASGTLVLLRPGVCLVMGSAIASDHTGKIGVCCFGLASQAGS